MKASQRIRARLAKEREQARGRPTAQQTRERVEKLRNMQPGQSIFVEGVTQTQMQSLRALANRERIKISIHEMQRDPIHRVAGCRVYRKPDQGDEL